MAKNGKLKRRTFRFSEPEYALIAANSEEETVKLYRTYVYPPDDFFEVNCLTIDFETDNINHLTESEIKELDNPYKAKPQVIIDARYI
ncbi:hypothetical protein GYW21_09670 [Lactobacillus mellis]|nr:hypothetical protein [Bombilactobacillus mellis]